MDYPSSNQRTHTFVSPGSDVENAQMDDSTSHHTSSSPQRPAVQLSCSQMHLPLYELFTGCIFGQVSHEKQPLWHSIILIGLIWILILAYYESPYNWVVWSPISNNQPGFWTLLTVSQGLSWRLVNIPIPWVAAWVFGKACQEQGGLTLAVLPRQYPWWSLMTVKSCMKGDTWHTKPILPCFYSHRIHGTGIFTYLHVR